ncbi:MAG TPA: hypothetical protein VLC09_00540 [Polyangiaceae bacterium]|nr:hypothetical protein [Polyangiaceae bacterium]
MSTRLLPSRAARLGSPWLRILLLGALLLLVGCGGVQVEATHIHAVPPSNVEIYVSVQDDGRPIDYLEDSSFEIYENDVLLQSADVGLRLLPRDSKAIGHTVLLLDLSGQGDEAYLTKLRRGAEHLGEKVSVTQGVTVLAFDGTPGVRTVATWPRVRESTLRELPDLTSFRSGDTSRDLFGGVLEAMAVLKHQMAQASQPVKLGTLIVLSLGPDLAGRRKEHEIYQALSESKAAHYLVTPNEVEIPQAAMLGEDGHYTYANIDELALRLQDLGMLVRKSWGRHYLLAYCSPARAGTREVTIQVRYDDPDGAGRSASGSTEFVADGFRAGCQLPSKSLASQLMEGGEPQTAAEPPPPTPNESVAPPATTIGKKKPAPASKPAPKSEPKPKPAEPKPTEPAPSEQVIAPPTSGKYK